MIPNSEGDTDERGEPPSNRPSEPELPQSRKRFAAFRSEFSSKLVGAIAVAAAAGVLATMTGFGSFVVERTGLAVASTLGPYIIRVVQSDLEDTSGALGLAVDRRIEAQINSTLGSVVAGTFSLQQESSRQAVAFYLPENHRVDLELEIIGLEPNEVLRLSTNAPEVANRVIEDDGVYNLTGLKSPMDEELAETVNFAMPQPERVRGPTKYFFPIVFTLAKSVTALGEVRQADEMTPLLSIVSVKYVGLLTPPIKAPR
jgi:hypothetical protein